MQVTNDVTDRELLLGLNDEYIASVRTSNVRRFSEILADDFVCSTPDGTILDRAQFLDQTGRATGLAALDAHDVVVHIFRAEVRAYYDLEGMWSVDETASRRRAVEHATPLA